MQFPKRQDLVRAQIQASRLRAAKNQFTKERTERNANTLLDELSSSRELLSGQNYRDTRKLLERSAQKYGSNLLRSASQILNVAESVVAELVTLANELDGPLELDGRL